MQSSQNLLVIEFQCGYSKFSQKIKRIFKEVRECVNGNTAKKLIFVTPESERLSSTESVELSADCLTKYDEVNFSDLTGTSRNKLLEEPNIIFQGLHEISFRELIGIRSCDDLATKKSPDFQGLIDSSTLSMMIRGQKIRVGKRLEELGDLEKIYMDRRINQVFLKTDVLTCSSPSDVFAISGINREGLVKLTGSETISRIKLFISDNGEERQQFAMLCKKSLESDVHWLKHVDGELIWKQSRGNITNLLNYRDMRKTYNSDEPTYFKHTTSKHLTEDDLTDHDKVGKVVIISDDSGSGKTTFFTSLAKELKNKDMKRWVIRINMNDVVGELDQEKEERKKSLDESNSARAIDFFVNKLANLENNFEKKFLREIIDNCSGVVVLFDGFDEIIPYYKELVTDLLQALKKTSGVEKIFISTRPIMKEFLEDSMGVFSYTMSPLTWSEQIDLLSGFFQVALSQYDVKRQVREYTWKLFWSLRISIGEGNWKFLAIPLHLKMIAEVYQDNEEGIKSFQSCQEFLNSKNSGPWLVKSTICDLYRRFFDKKRRIHFEEKKKEIIRNVFVRSDLEETLDNFIKKHQELAMYTLLKPADLDTLLPDWREMESIKTCMDTVNPRNGRTELITHLVDGKPQFAHRSFAEYSFASFLIDKLNQAHHDQELQEFLVRRILLPLEYRLVRNFLNEMLQNKPPYTNLQVEDKESAAASWISVINKHRSDTGHTIFHIAETETNAEIIKFVLNPFHPLDQSWGDLIVTKQSYPSRSNSDYQSCMDIAKYYVEQCGIHPNEIRIGVTSTPLYSAVRSNNLLDVKWLIRKGADPRAEARLGQSTLVFATVNDRFEIVKWFIDEEGIEVDYRDKNGLTLLQIAAQNDSLTICKWLVEEKNVNLEAKDNNAKSALDLAFHKQSWKVMNWLIQKLGGQYEFIDGSTIVGKVSDALDREWNEVSFMVNWDAVDVREIDENRQMELKDEINACNLEEIRWLVSKGVEVYAHRRAGSVQNYVTDQMLVVLQWWERNTGVKITDPDHIRPRLQLRN